ncbi:hypothetical protein K435DRAFT_861340 [Dendrothele bispora CBS 962.96]|uniref:P-type ATPase A domain-containing protein n=1 Tax=Dendrothele bispora (strain CBS 962.96) TaxID=1314807 RepID=A0A4S8LWV1_DENBC|nr:hypothetical protein K435DRAFT_861340 [Dendrothele bispora CBS 962.96]
MRVKGVEMKRTITQEDRDLTAAGLTSELGTFFNSKDPSASTGLTAGEAKEHLARNVFTPHKKKSALRKYFDRLMTMFNILLILACILELTSRFGDNFANTYLGGILIAIAFLNAFIDWFQSQKSEILASFLAMIPPSCRIVCDGTLQTISAADLVLGDVVLVRVGDKTPADIVLFSATDLKIDNSSLTRESEPQERRPLPSGSPSRAVEAENLIFNSTLVINMVARTGDHTLIGQVARLTSGEAGNEAPLAIEIGRFVIQVSCIAIVFAIVFFIVGITTVYKGSASKTVTFTMLVAFVPEGLPSVVTLFLSIAAKRMAKQNMLAKDLQGVETLAKIDSTVPLAHPSGYGQDRYLTRNQMTVTNLWNGTKMLSTFQSKNDDQEIVPFSMDVSITALNSSVKFDSEMEILGDATETGLTRFAGRCLGSDYDVHLEKYPKVFEGALEHVLAKCSTHMKDGVLTPVDEAFKAAYDEAYDVIWLHEVVIACAQALLPSDKYPLDYAFSKNDGNYPNTDYCFVGLVSLKP